MLRLLVLDAAGDLTALASDRADLVKPPLDADAYLNALARGGLFATAAALRLMAELAVIDR